MGQPVHPLVQLAREAIKGYLEKKEIIEPPEELTPEMRERHGVFVSLKIKGRLRGCIGTFEPATSTVAEEIILNAISAATRDPRFMPLTLSEFKETDVSVDVLTTPESVISPVLSEAALDPKRYGIIVKSNGRCGLLLPDLEGVDTVEQQVGIARAKAGIGENEPVELFSFEIRRYR
ncbi:MAG: AmmeMemoRadiSam system protein A [Nitrospirae bacterium]|nr:AmmeMemoRadiSam system protein A [Nitrospirota bacterium]MBI5096534.1 AmmeMemoRadiSam system protein A [Nitrospirota bacterium]